MWICFPANCRNHHDDAKCDRWALTGECQLNAVWMKDNCQRSCRACADTQNPDGEDDEKKEEEEGERRARYSLSVGTPACACCVW